VRPENWRKPHSVSIETLRDSKISIRRKIFCDVIDGQDTLRIMAGYPEFFVTFFQLVEHQKIMATLLKDK